MTEKEKYNLDFRPNCYWQRDAFDFERIAKTSAHKKISQALADDREHYAIPAIKQKTIARILIGGGKKDVILIRAYQKGDLIHYRVTDMLHFAWGASPTCAIETSTEPLTLKQLIYLIDHSIHPKLEGKGLIMPWLQKRIVEAGPDNFVGYVQAKSNYYPELQSWYQDHESEMLDQYYDLQVPNNMQNSDK
ncbi:MAG: hypothetical protein JEZ07_03970 [Phycisphaerae bacterium]|nr:hypothetical protein [Phycisphaerae bacterium]